MGGRLPERQQMVHNRGQPAQRQGCPWRGCSLLKGGAVRRQEVCRVLRQGGQEEGREAEEGTAAEEREACREDRGGGRWYAQGAQSQGSPRSTSQGHLRPGGVEEILLQQRRGRLYQVVLGALRCRALLHLAERLQVQQ